MRSTIFSSRNVYKNFDEENNKSEITVINGPDVVDMGDDDSLKKNNKVKDWPSLCNAIMIYFLSIHTLYFYNALLFSDKTISRRYNLKYKIGIYYLLTNEFDRIFLVFFISEIINKIFVIILEWLKESLNSAYKIENENEINYKNDKNFFVINCKDDNIIEIRAESSNEKETEKAIDLIKAYKLKMILFHIFIIIVQLLYLYFFLIFGNVNPNIQFSLLWSSLIIFVVYIIFNLIYDALKANIEERIKENNNCLKCLYKLKTKIKL